MYYLLTLLFFAECVTNDSFNCVEFINAYDGDTVKVNIKGVHPLIGKKGLDERIIISLSIQEAFKVGK